MSREAHVRFWEGVGVQFPRATRLSARLRQCVRSACVDFQISGVLQSWTPALEP